MAVDMQQQSPGTTSTPWFGCIKVLRELWNEEQLILPGRPTCLLVRTTYYLNVVKAEFQSITRYKSGDANARE